MPTRLSLLAFLSFATIAAPLAAQQRAAADGDDVESRQRPPRLAAGLTVGTLHRDGGLTDQSMVAILQLQPRPWLALSVAPGIGRIAYTGTALSRKGTPAATATTNGLTDIPITVGAAHGFDPLPWSPSLAAAVTQSLATGSSATGLGLGHATTSFYGAVSASPADRFDLSVGSWLPLSSGSGTASLDLEGALSLGRTTATLGYSAEMGTIDSGSMLARSVVGGVAFSLAGPLTLTVDAGHGLTSGAPNWNFDIGFGTAFAGLSPLNATSPLRRMKKAFGAKASSSNGYKKKP